MIKAEYQRKDFSIIKKSFKQLGKGNVRLTQSSLILLQDINPTKSVYTFPVLENDNSTGFRPQEIKLNQNDEFTITQLGIYGVAEVSFNPELPNEKGLVYITHAPYNSNEVNAGNIKPLWNGYLKIAVNNIVYVDKFDTIKSEQTQRTQFNTADATQNNGSTIASISMETDGMNQLAPSIQLSGSKKNEISLILNQAVNTLSWTITNNVGDAVTYNLKYIGLIMRGLLAQNGAVFQSSSMKK